MSGVGFELDSELKKMMSAILLLNKNLGENFSKKNFTNGGGNRWKLFH